MLERLAYVAGMQCAQYVRGRDFTRNVTLLNRTVKIIVRAMGLPLPPTTCANTSGRPTNQGFQFQLRDDNQRLLQGEGHTVVRRADEAQHVSDAGVQMEWSD